MNTNSSASENPFIPLSWATRSQQQSEEEYISNLRKTLQWWDHWRWVGVALYAAIFTGIVGVGCQSLSLIRGLQPVFADLEPKVELVFLPAAAAGMTFGFLFYKSVWMVMALIGGLKAERLLIKYHDRRPVLETSGKQVELTEPNRQRNAGASCQSVLRTVD